MAAYIKDGVDQRLAEIYSSKVTVNLDSKSTMSPDDFWNSMNLIAMNNKIFINYKK